MMVLFNPESHECWPRKMSVYDVDEERLASIVRTVGCHGGRKTSEDVSNRAIIDSSDREESVSS
jgi:hypothetical protein